MNTRPLRRCTRFALLGALALLTACGGGGGGGGGGGPKPGDGSGVSFLGFSFRTGPNTTTNTPPLEDPTASPPSLGGPLTTVVIFRFDGPPSGPLNQTTLPVFTTPSDVPPSVGAPATIPVIPAKGTYVLVGNDVEFRPFVPTQPLQATFGAPAAAVPGFFPGAVYTAQVSTNPLAKIDNLVGGGGQVEFGLTSNPAAFFPQDPDTSGPPEVLATTPASGSSFFPGVFSNTPLGGGAPIFPADPDSVVIEYDRPLLPTQENLFGKDIDGDGVVDGNFFLRSRATELLVGHQVPANTFGAHAAFAAVSGLEEGGAPAQNGDDVVLQGDAVLPDPDAGLAAQPVSLASGRDPGLLFAILEVVGGSDLLTVADQLLGDPSFAQLAVDPEEGGAPGTLDTGLESAVGLTTLLDGRLVVYDQDTQRIHELLPTVIRRRPTVDGPAEPPILLSLALGDGTNGFLSDPVIEVGGPLITDLAQSPTGELYALGTFPGESLPNVLRLQPIDPDGNGSFAPGEGTFQNEAGDIVLALDDDYADMVFVGDHTVLALNRGADTIDRIDIISGNTTTVVSDVAAFGLPLSGFPGGLSPARALTVGHLELDVEVELLSNGSSGADVRLRPRGVLPIGQEIAVLQRKLLTSLAGGNDVVSNPEQPVVSLGGETVASFSTSVPAGGPDAPVDDLFLEEFVSKQFEGDVAASLGPKAEWAKPLAGGQSTGVLRASTGLSDVGALGDFLPQTPSNFNPSQAYVRGPVAPPQTIANPNNGSSNYPDTGNGAYSQDHDVDTSKGNFLEIFLNTDAQSFPLPGGATPGVTAPVTVQGGQFAFRDIVIPAGVKVIARGSNPLVLTAERDVIIGGMIDVSGTEGLTDDSFDSGFLPVRGGPGGPGGGRGGDGHPTLFDPTTPGGGTIDQYVTPEVAESGFGPVISKTGQVSFQMIGGVGGTTTAGYLPVGSDDSGYPGGTPNVPLEFPDMPGFTNAIDAFNTTGEFSRPPGGGGGSFRTLGTPSYEGAGAYLVESQSAFGSNSFTNCPNGNNFVEFIVYGNEWNRQPTTPVGPTNFLQCVYMLGTRDNHQHIIPGSAPGTSPFQDADPDNDFIGEGGELPVLIGGQGGGAGATRVDSIDFSEWAQDRLGTPVPTNVPYPLLLLGPVVSATAYDSKGGGGGGGGGALQIRAFGDIVIKKTAYLDASGGLGGGGEVIGNSIGAGGGGGGSGGAILLQAAGDITIEADPTNTEAVYIDADDGAQGGALDVSGGFGDDARTDPDDPNTAFERALSYDENRGDGGQGGMGLIQLQAGGQLTVQQGATLFANQRAVLKYGDGSNDDAWNPRLRDDQREHPDLSGLYDEQDDNDIRPFAVRYIDLLHYRFFNNDDSGPVDVYYTLNGAHPPIIPHDTGDMGQNIVHEFPEGSGEFWGDTKMMEHPDIPGLMVVQDPEPEKLIKEMNPIEDTLRLDDDVTPSPTAYIQANLKNAVDQLFNGPGNPGADYEPELAEIYGQAPGIPYEPDDKVPFSVRLSQAFIAQKVADVPKNQTSGNPILIEQDGKMIRDPSVMVKRLPVVHPSKTPVALSTKSLAISEWLDFAGPTLRTRALDGRTPPFFAAINGTYNAQQGGVPAGKPSGGVMKSGPAPLAPSLAKLVKGAEGKLFGSVPINDIAVDAPDVPTSSMITGIQDAISNNANVRLEFQGAYAVRAGSHVPDLDTLSPWVADITQLDGFPLVRFRVVFELDADPSLPFGAQSFRPAVDYVRVRPSY